MLNIGDFARLGPVSPRMLRHYDQLGLLEPEYVDPVTNYRWYGVGQLARLHQLLTFRDLGFGLDEIASLLEQEPTVDQLRALLQKRRDDIESTIDAERNRLSRVEAHINALEGSGLMSTQNIVIKQAQPVRVAEMTKVVGGYGYENIGPAFRELVPLLFAELQNQNVEPVMCVGYYEDARDDGSVVAHVGFDIGQQDVSATDDLQLVELPSVEVASVMHKGGFEQIDRVYEPLLKWVDDSGHHRDGLCRELYLEWNEQDPSQSVTEIQVPIATNT
jgi:DNA-binding transcriptional MerR regulator